MSAGPARAYGLEPPKVAVGVPGEPRPARHAGELAGVGGRLPLRSKNSWLIGEKLRGRVRATIAAGRLVHGS